MSDDVNFVPEAPEAFEQEPEKKSKKTLWIILAVVAVVLLCCCLIVVSLFVVPGIFGYSSIGDMLGDLLFEVLPYLALV